MSRACLATLLGLGACACAQAARSQCIDYGEYLHWIGGAGTPGAAFGVAVSGGYAYVASWDSGLQVVDVSDPDSPVIF